jgi:hypothetical protein
VHLLARLGVVLERLETATEQPERQTELAELLADERARVAGRSEDCDGSRIVGQAAEDTVRK